MTPIDARAAREILASFPVAFVVIGSFAGFHRGENPLEHVHDVDVLVRYDAGEIEAILYYLETHHFEVRIWNEPAPRPITAHDIAGKHYVRASRGSLTIDVTFDLEHIPFDVALATSVVRDGLVVCAHATPRAS